MNKMFFNTKHRLNFHYVEDLLTKGFTIRESKKVNLIGIHKETNTYKYLKCFLQKCPISCSSLSTLGRFLLNLMPKLCCNVILLEKGTGIWIQRTPKSMLFSISPMRLPSKFSRNYFSFLQYWTETDEYFDHLQLTKESYLQVTVNQASV